MIDRSPRTYYLGFARQTASCSVRGFGVDGPISLVTLIPGELVVTCARRDALLNTCRNQQPIIVHSFPLLWRKQRRKCRPNFAQTNIEVDAAVIAWDVEMDYDNIPPQGGQ